jgi:DNA-binding winged helix-turn-helix (wHTH) protein/TolB-like protein
MTASHRLFRFADYTFDADTGELVGPTGNVRLQPQPAKVLAALLARPGELVARDELKRLVWPDTVVEADQGLNFCVRQIRAALGDEADAGRFIETLPRRGYRLVVPVSNSRPEPSAATQQAASQPRRKGARSIGKGALILLALIGGVSLYRAGTNDTREENRYRVRLAIIPFVAPSGERWMMDLNRDLTERLVSELAVADSGRIGIVGPVTTAPYAGDMRPHTELGAKLGVDVVLSGGIRSSDSTLFVQAIRVSDGTHVVVWREKVYARDPADIVGSILSATRGKID